MTVPPADLVGRNRLGDASSPYLLQHRANPVHWWPWGAEAFAAARALDRPVFLSIGYSTCYWCHVMERESFENDAIATIMNEHFVTIKVDREERPDVDDAYMAAVQVMNRGQGGWPMSVFLDPATRRPFLAGTYFPPEDRWGRPGFPALLLGIAEAWRDRRAEILAQADEVAEAVVRWKSGDGAPGGGAPLDGGAVEEAVAELVAAHDREHGGFGRGGPKFPTPVQLELLLAAAWTRADVRGALLHTLDRMAMGGLCDQVGGGFHRYSVDERWLVPHFEKMLYDNGQLASVYAEAFARTGARRYERVVRRLLAWVEREMSAPDGAFLSAQDAEAEHREGLTYLWDEDEVRAALTAAGRGDDAALVVSAYGLAGGPNFRDPHHPDDEPRTVLHRPRLPADEAAAHGLPEDELEARLDAANAALLAVREARPQPITDDKILASWNGLMIRGFADAARGLDEPAFAARAARAARAVLEGLRGPDGTLCRTRRGGGPRIPAFLEDYASLAWGLLGLHEADGAPRWLEAAAQLVDEADARLADPAGAWHDAAADPGELYVRVRSRHDGAVPSGNALMTLVCARLHRASGEAHWRARAERALAALSPSAREHPGGATVLLRAVVELGADPAPTPASAARGPLRATLEAAGDRVELRLEIATGHHVAAADPGRGDVLPLRVEVLAPVDAAIEPRLPVGETMDGPLGPMRVLAGVVRVPLVGADAGRRPLRVAVRAQACHATACLPPATLVVEQA